MILTYVFAGISVILLALLMREKRKREDCEFLLELEKNWERRYHEMNEAHDKNSKAKDKLLSSYESLHLTESACIDEYKLLCKTQQTTIETLKQLNS